MPERTFSSPEYRYGFNGKEKDEDGEWGDLTHYDYGFRIYNPGIGKFLSVDPLTPEYPMLTPFQFAHNSPIVAIDLDGLEAEGTNEQMDDYFNTKETAEDLPLTTVTAERTTPKRKGYHSQDVERYGYNGYWDQYAEQYGLQDISYENYSEEWDKKYSEAFRKSVEEADRLERERIALEKLTLFLAYFKGAEQLTYVYSTSYGLSAVVRTSSLFSGGARMFHNPLTGNVFVNNGTRWGFGGGFRVTNLTQGYVRIDVLTKVGSPGHVVIGFSSIGRRFDFALSRGGASQGSGIGGVPIKGQNAGGHINPLGSANGYNRTILRVPSQNAADMFEAARSMGASRYNLFFNNCATNACSVLRSGGVNVGNGAVGSPLMLQLELRAQSTISRYIR